jgi:hypothetical protein
VISVLGSEHGRGAGARWLARCIRHTFALIVLRLSCSSFWVVVRLVEINGRWIASADTPDGPSLGLGCGAVAAIEAALAPFEGIVDELMAACRRRPGARARPT